MIGEVIRKIAEIKGIPFEEARDTIYQNTCRFYNIR